MSSNQSLSPCDIAAVLKSPAVREAQMGQSTASSKEDDVFALLKNAKDGDTKALQKLVEHAEVQSRALVICQRVIRRNPKTGYYRDAEDLRQELFVLFWQNFRRFRCENGMASLWKFLDTLAHNIHLSQARKLKRELKQSEDKSFDELNIASQEDPYFLMTIKKALSSLDEKESYILQQRLNGKGLVEIAEEAPFHIGKSTVFRILENVQKKFIERVEGCKDKRISKQRSRKTKPEPTEKKED